MNKEGDMMMKEAEKITAKGLFCRGYPEVSWTWQEQDIWILTGCIQETRAFQGNQNRQVVSCAQTVFWQMDLWKGDNVVSNDKQKSGVAFFEGSSWYHRVLSILNAAALPLRKRRKKATIFTRKSLKRHTEPFWWKTNQFPRSDFRITWYTGSKKCTQSALRQQHGW